MLQAGAVPCQHTFNTLAWHSDCHVLRHVYYWSYCFKLALLPPNCPSEAQSEGGMKYI